MSNVLVLNHHADYACRRSGACCTAGWRIPVEADRMDGVLTLLTEDEAFEEGTRILRLTAAGECVLLSARHARLRPFAQAACALHRAHGHAALPSACRHFPRVYLHDAHASRVTLSHFCPTAASLLFEPGELAVVEASMGLATPHDREGLDARDALPPLLRPGMLMDVESYAVWEALAIDTLRVKASPEDALRSIAAAVERLRKWRPDGPTLREAVSEAASCSHEEDGSWVDTPATRRWLIEAAHASVPEDLCDRRRGLVAAVDLPESGSEWIELAEPVRRFLAGHLFGSWVAYLGRGLRTVVASVACALAVLRDEVARARADGARPLDAALLTEAIRTTDLLLVHMVDGQAFADRLSAVEIGPLGAGSWRLGVNMDPCPP